MFTRYCILLIIVCLICLICMILYDINYYYSCSIYAATLYVECGLIYCMSACAPVCMCLAKRDQRLRKFRLRAWFEIYWQPRNFRRVRFWKTTAERCLSSYCWVVSYLCFDTLWNFSGYQCRLAPLGANLSLSTILSWVGVAVNVSDVISVGKLPNVEFK